VAVRVKTIGRRHSYYLAHIRECLEEARLNPHRKQIMEPGWSKVRLYAHLLTEDNYEAWTEFAGDNTAEVVAQAAARGRPSVPRDEKIRTILFRLPVGVRTELIQALQERGWQFQPGKKQARDGDERAVRKLLRDAALGKKGRAR
jgi:hypothetical protein